ncbi:hypothetical protein CISIN_1g042732mg [Citrus sinensis]|uniref:DC1 domain-containing protein n=1 Tax=Citrus sinensis TaxID=2711 RepID=A0A067EA78_CITSI|nr:hypothetical protein CISIN_1g042732mg [Citrus sinensis]
MAPLHGQKTIHHFTHPNHKLLEINDDNEYLCGGCKTPGSSKRFRCHGCDFDLHEYCGICPMTLSSFMHPQHQLNLVNRIPQATRQNARSCDVCGDSIEGLFYRCKLCEFDVHPVCTQLPQQVRHVLDAAHPLTLQPFSSAWCMVCRNECTSWRYRCGICGVDIHLECLLTPCDHASRSTSSSSTTRSRSVPQPAAPPAFGAHYANYNYGAPPLGAYNYAYGVPYGFGPYNSVMSHQQQQGNEQQAGGGGGRFRRRMFKIVGNIALGVFTNAVFGV